jgi:hypothetical protein
MKIQVNIALSIADKWELDQIVIQNIIKKSSELFKLLIISACSFLYNIIYPLEI